MRAPRQIPTFFLLLLSLSFWSAPGFAAEVAELRNGFTVPHCSREMRDGKVRLFTDEAKQSFVDIPANDIQSYSIQPDPEPVAAAQKPAVRSKPPAAQAIIAASVPAQDAAKSTDQIVREASKIQGVDSDFIHSVIQQESGGNTRAVSRAGARGLMQLMPGTAAQLGVADSFSPEQNVHGGARYLRELLERYHGDAIKALAAYNAGPGAVDRYRGVPPYRETRLYVQRIVRKYNSKKQNGPRAQSRVPDERKQAERKVSHGVKSSAQSHSARPSVGGSPGVAMLAAGAGQPSS